jgi:hypothetical protein
MPKPKLIQFGDPEPPQQRDEPEPTPSNDVFNEKPKPKATKKAQKFRPPDNLQVVAPPEPEPEPEVEYDEPASDPEPAYVTEPVKKVKKPISEKQRAHLERMRQKRAEKRSATQPARPTTNMPQDNSRPTTTGGMDEDQEFSKWLKNYEKFDKVLSAREEKERKKREEEERKEAEIEARIRKKIEDENKQRMGQQPRAPVQQTQPIPILQQQQQNRFGEFSSMFGY